MVIVIYWNSFTPFVYPFIVIKLFYYLIVYVLNFCHKVSKIFSCILDNCSNIKDINILETFCCNATTHQYKTFSLDINAYFPLLHFQTNWIRTQQYIYLYPACTIQTRLYDLAILDIQTAFLPCCT